MANQSLYQSYADYILYDATWSGTAPLATYSLTEYGYIRPDWRVKYGASSVTITATLGAPRRGDIAAVAISNVDAAVLTITNGAGLSQPMLLNTPSPGGWPSTSWIDLTINNSDPTVRTSNVWNFIVTGNSVNVTFGAALWISGPKRALAYGFDKQAERSFTYARAVKTNEYQVDFVLDLMSRKQELDGTTTATSEADRAAMANWIDGSRGASRPSLFVRDTSVNEALLCYANETYTERRLTPNAWGVSFKLTELAKGIPIT